MSADVSTPRRPWPFPAQDLEQQPEVRQLMARAFEEGADAMDVAAREAVRRGLDELRAALCAVAVVGTIDGRDVIRRESVIDLVDRRRGLTQEAG